MDNDRRGALFGVQLELLGQTDLDPLRFQKRKELGLILEVGAGGIAKRIAAAMVFLVEPFANLWSIFVRDAELLTHPAVPQLSQAFRSFDAQPMQVQVIAIG